MAVRSDDKHPFMARLDPKLYDKLRQTAFTERGSMNAIVVRALEKELARK